MANYWTLFRFLLFACVHLQASVIKREKTYQELLRPAFAVSRCGIASKLGPGSCNCNGWEHSPLLPYIEAAWGVWSDGRRPLHTSPSEFFHRLQFLGSSFAETRRYCSNFISEFAAATDQSSDQLYVRAIDAFALDTLGGPDTTCHSICPPMWARLSFLCGLKMSFASYGWLPRGDNFFVYGAMDQTLYGDIMIDWAIALAFYCSSEEMPDQFDMPGFELRANARQWTRRFANLDVTTGRPNEFLEYLPLNDWLRTEEKECPPEEADDIEVLPRSPSVLCLIVVTWPEEEALVYEIADTWALQCNLCIFFIASEGPSEIGMCRVVDLRIVKITDEWDVHQVGESIGDIVKNVVPKKLQAIYEWAGILGSQLELEWTCFVESDVYFAVHNFRRLVLRRGLSSTDSHWLGYMHMDSMVEEGITVEPFHGTCLSRAAVRKARDLRSERLSDHVALWPPTKYACRELGRHDLQSESYLVTNVLNSCMRIASPNKSGNLAGVLPSDPELTFDHRGRLLYLDWTALNCNILNDPNLMPPSRPFHRTPVPLNLKTQQIAYWKGREYIYSRCLGKNRRWIGYYPIMFHGHVTHDVGFLQQLKGTRSAWKANASSQREVHDFLVENKWRLPDELSC